MQRYTAPLQTDNWFHRYSSISDIIANADLDRERVLRSEEMEARLPSDWSQRQRLVYLYMRLGKPKDPQSLPTVGDKTLAGIWV